MNLGEDWKCGERGSRRKGSVVSVRASCSRGEGELGQEGGCTTRAI